RSAPARVCARSADVGRAGLAGVSQAAGLLVALRRTAPIGGIRTRDTAHLGVQPHFGRRAAPRLRLRQRAGRTRHPLTQIEDGQTPVRPLSPRRLRARRYSEPRSDPQSIAAAIFIAALDIQVEMVAEL